MTQPLGSAITISKGKKHEVIESPSSSAKRLIGIDDLRNDDLLRYTDDIKGVEATPEDVLIAWDGANAGTIGYGKSGFIGSTIARLRINPESKLFTPFLGLYLKSQFDYLRKTATGATIPHINRRALESILLPNIEFNDQVRIAHLLSKVEGLIAQRKQHLQQLDVLLKSVFLEMFGDPMSNPKKWPDSGLGEALTFLQYGPRFYNEKYSAEGTRIVRITDLSERGTLDFSAMPRLDVTSDEKEKFLLMPGDLIFARTGATVGKVALIRRDDPPAIAGAYFIVMRFKPTLHPLYVRSVLTSSSVRATIAERSRQAAQQNFSGPGLRKLPMPVPPIKLQNNFVKICNEVEKLEDKYQNSLNDLQDLYGVLSQQAFKGELDLSRISAATQHIDSDIFVNQAKAFSPAAEQLITINLPETDLLLPALHDRKLVKDLLHKWLEIYCAQLDDAAFSVASFMNAAQIRIAELHPDTDFELTANDYEHIKTWIFEGLYKRKLTQAVNITGYDKDGKPISGNFIEIKYGASH